MLRFFAGVAACFLLLTGAFLIWQSPAQQALGLPAAPAAHSSGGSLLGGAELQAPEANEKTRKEKRFGRADKNKDGKIQADEYLAARRRFFDKLDADHSGTLTFQEYAAKAIEKFQGADHGRKGWLSEAEFATTAPPPPKHKACSCRAPAAEATSADENTD